MEKTFKVGDRVRVLGNKCSMSGDIAIVTGVTGDIIEYRALDNSDACVSSKYGAQPGHELEVVEKTIDNLQKGDVLLDTNGDETTVLARLEDLVFLSYYNTPDSVRTWRTIKQIKDDGYKLKSDEPQELTVAEISEKLGYEVKVVK